MIGRITLRFAGDEAAAVPVVAVVSVANAVSVAAVASVEVVSVAVVSVEAGSVVEAASVPVVSLTMLPLGTRSGSGAVVAVAGTAGFATAGFGTGGFATTGVDSVARPWFCGSRAGAVVVVRRVVVRFGVLVVDRRVVRGAVAEAVFVVGGLVVVVLGVDADGRVVAVVVGVTGAEVDGVATVGRVLVTPTRARRLAACRVRKSRDSRVG